MEELFDKMQKLEMAVFVRNEVKNYAYRAGHGSLSPDIYIYETEAGWAVSIPEAVRRTKLNQKKGGKVPTGIKLEEGRSFIEQAIINGIKKYLSTRQMEGKVTVK